MIDKIISTVVTMVLVLLAGIVLYISVFTGQTGEQALARQSYEQEYGVLLVNSILLSYENESDLTYESLLALALQEVNTTVDVAGARIDVESVFSQVFDALVGVNNYYFEVEPVLSGVSVSYVLDGSATMAPSRQEVNDKLPDLVATLETLFGADASIFTHIYILDTSNNQKHCPAFTLQPGMTCDDLVGDEFYNKLMQRGFEPPIPDPYNTFIEWVAATKAAGTTALSESDWASGVAYASYAYHDATQEKALTNKHVIVTVADELSSGSKADECFGLASPSDLTICQLCDNTCPVMRAERVVNATRDLLKDHDDLFLGFYSYRCDYEYSSFLDNFPLSPYTCQFMDVKTKCFGVKDLNDPSTPPGWVNPPAEVNWCDQDACGGCVPSGANYCFHQDCNTAITKHLNELASATGGLVLDLTDLSQLTDEVYNYFNNQIASFNFSIGVKNETHDRFVIERPFTLSSGNKITLTFWIYD